jgi:MFS family permease
VLSYVISLAAALDVRGRWAVLVGSAASLGTAAGPLTGSVLSARAGFPAMGEVLAAVLLLAAVPMTAVALRTAPRRLRVVEIPIAAAPRTELVPVGEVPSAPFQDLPVVEISLRETPVPDPAGKDVRAGEILVGGATVRDLSAKGIPVVQIPFPDTSGATVPA